MSSQKCHCFTIQGKQCSRKATHGTFCWQHAKKCVVKHEPSLKEAPLKEPPEWDFDRTDPIPPSMKDLEYVYAAGSSPSEIMRYWILPPDWKLSVQKLPESGEQRPPPQVMSVKEYLTLLKTDPYIVYRILANGKKLSFNNQMLSEDPHKRAQEILSTNIVNMVNFRENILPQIRKNGKIVKQYTNADLDELEKIMSN